MALVNWSLASLRQRAPEILPKSEDQIVMRGSRCRVERRGSQQTVPSLGRLTGLVLVESATCEPILALSDASDVPRLVAQWDAVLEPK